MWVKTALGEGDCPHRPPFSGSTTALLNMHTFVLWTTTSGYAILAIYYATLLKAIE